MEKDLRLLVKNVYGQRRIYPACEKSMVLAKMLGSKSIPEYQIDYLKELGYEVKLEGWTGFLAPEVLNTSPFQPSA